MKWRKDFVIERPAKSQDPDLIEHLSDQKEPDPLGSHWTLTGWGTRAYVTNPLSPDGCEMEPPSWVLFWHVPRTQSISLGSGNLECRVDSLRSLSPSSSSSWAALAVEQGTRSCLGNAIALKDSTSSAMLLVWWRISRTQGFYHLASLSPPNNPVLSDSCCYKTLKKPKLYVSSSVCVAAQNYPPNKILQGEAFASPQLVRHTTYSPGYR